MNNQVVEKARELLGRNPGLTFPLDVEELVSKTGCELVEWPFLPPVKEVKHGRWIGVTTGLDRSEHRYLAAHALGHHFLHCGNQLWFRDWQGTSVLRQEREADEFAAHILVPEVELEKLGNPTAWEIAEHFGVPEELAASRLDQFATAREKERWQLFEN